MDLYDHAEWRCFREDVIRLDGGRCVRCSRGRDDAVLQVHHKRYVAGRRPWEYAHDDCETLCKGCHAEEHGIIMPSTGWLLLATDDLGDLSGSCELCGQALRYSYAIIHPKWGSMAVGTNCCDRLTGTCDASEHHEQAIRRRDRLRRFLDSPGWTRLLTGELVIVRYGIAVRIIEKEGKFLIALGVVLGRTPHATLSDAQTRAFELIDSGEAAGYLAKHRRRQLGPVRQQGASSR